MGIDKKRILLKTLIIFLFFSELLKKMELGAGFLIEEKINYLLNTNNIINSNSLLLSLASLSFCLFLLFIYLAKYDFNPRKKIKDNLFDSKKTLLIEIISFSLLPYLCSLDNLDLMVSTYSKTLIIFIFYLLSKVLISKLISIKIKFKIEYFLIFLFLVI
jgi:hypothetical protein